LDIVVKLALGSERGAALRNEYKIYHLMRESGITAGITTPLGLFDDVQGGASALVMPYAGTPLAARPDFILTVSYQCSTLLSYFHPHFSDTLGNREAVLANLKEIHRADVLHGDLRLDNILVADSGLTIIDFGRSQVCCDPDAKNREYSQLQSLLA
jgi:tRNA A-37 threonylcarbamoyl transferase component Bud32